MPFTVEINRRFAAAAAAVSVTAAVVGCSGSDTADQKQKRENYESAARKVTFPAEALKNPLERVNAAEKLKRDSDPNRLSYVYLLSLDGKVISHFVAKGKVSSADSQLLPTQEVRDVCGDGCVERMQFEAAGDDSTFGAREPGIFFFTTEGQMITWSGDFVQSDRPLSIKTPISLVADAK
jgi:hypothetical protein